MSNILITIGIVVLLVGVLLRFTGGTIPLLPGDILVKKDNFTFYFPIVSSILLSIILTILISIFRR